MKTIYLSFLLLIVGLTSCGSAEMDSQLVKSLIVGYDRGVVSGVDVGDSWDTVKENLSKDWDQGGSETSFIKEYDDMNFVVLSIDLDENDQVWQMSMSISGKEVNHLLMAEIKNELTKEFNVKYEVSEDGNGWGFIAANGDDCGINMNESDSGNGNKSLSVSVVNYSL